MALNAIEQLNMIRDKKPSEKITFLALIHQIGIDKAKDWYDSLKNTDADALATSYKNKYGNTIAKVVSSDNQTLMAVRQVLVSILGDTGFEYSNFEIEVGQQGHVDEAAWIGFTNTSIQKAIEYVAGINNLEKAAYTAL